MLHNQKALSTRLLNSLKIQKVCDKCANERKCSASVHTEVVSIAEEVTRISLRKSV
jgi:hypothetical protein